MGTFIQQPVNCGSQCVKHIFCSEVPIHKFASSQAFREKQYISYLVFPVYSSVPSQALCANGTSFALWILSIVE
jgi:hypothetical protein